ncbi:MAG: DUF3037 domain-containing protein [Saprospiraceae bacterium]|nr:DUF3037 domain-containing protein [Saprospiraceae bacterium]MCF8252882.1 DUF3037 domain-containing protein [Saprospiraceae bacterium]MCF8314428.1 DUF3037 domain-containing protein [Saprospiraceae bacterium]MCF8443318.1 DUF3037 domain-containing protein [Saprospiraceae bacterium]
MRETCQYTLLQYQHSLLLGERLNVGLLVVFPHLKKLYFRHPANLKRLKAVYPQVPEQVLKNYFQGFIRKTELLNKQPELFSGYNIETDPADFIQSEFLIADDSALQFCKARTALQFSPSPEVVVEQLYNLHLGLYEAEEESRDQHNEAFLSQQYKKLIREQHPEVFSRNLIHENHVIEKLGNHYQFDYAWQNGTLNLVKPVSFDLLKPESIVNKATRYFGEFTLLEDEADAQQLRFDVLLAKPRHRQLFKTHDNALRLLEKPRHVKLVEETKLADYSQLTLQSLLDD